ncbi:hypothetical protein MNBD_GAMMA22-1124 [hydrothermal vent metagenome]|uniref:RNA polymerase ECF-type sigma factor n=1 Tax=hydrothermal vent metagenome TaxID=652676 RepID=A0A3B1AKY4_9ZZZZ
MQLLHTAANLSLAMNDDLDNESDENLMLRYRDGDVNAFEVLYSRHKAALFRYFTRQCSEPAIAEELFQECWMNVIKARKSYVDSAKFTTYVYTIAHNKLIDHYRRKKLQFIDILNANDSLDGINELPAPKKQQPEQIAVKQQKRAMLLLAVNLLPQVQREVFLLREESALSLAEIAKITNINIETVKSRLRYAIASLKKTIQTGDS